MKITIYKDGNLLRIRPLLPDVLHKLADTLRYTKKKSLVTYEERKAANGRKIEFTEVTCYDVRTIGGEQQLITNAGYLPRILAALEPLKATVDIKDLRPHPEQLYKPCWENIAEKELRPRQMDVLKAVAANERGRIWFATGTGKSYLIPLICKVYPKLNIVVTTKHMAVLDDLYHNLCRQLPSVGTYSSRKKITGKRIMCYSSGSLQHADPDKTQILIADEIQELGSDLMFERLAQFRFCRMFGMSANMNDRFDGADFELEGIFGPIIAQLTYEEGVSHGMIVPIEVRWRNVFLDRNPGEDHEGVAKQRHGIWRNKQRNLLIAKDANSFVDDQVLITVTTFDHACHLKQLLPNYELVYSPNDQKEEDIDKYVKWKLLDKGEPLMTVDRLDMLKKRFETGALRKVIATTVWNRGVNFKQLQVLIRADASASAIADTQIPGRLSRTTEAQDKHCGILIDYLDQFDSTFSRKAMIRKSNYESKGWRNLMPERS